jgi:hypothetical protein
MNFPRSKFKRNPIKGLHTGKSLGNALNLQQWNHSVVSSEVPDPTDFSNTVKVARPCELGGQTLNPAWTVLD